MSRMFMNTLAVIVIAVGAAASGTPVEASSRISTPMCTISCPPKSGCVLCGGGCTDLPGGAVAQSCVWVCGGACALLEP